jgi:ubiquinone/menaquinone biosynthesis C-methylase UbiE
MSTLRDRKTEGVAEIIASQRPAKPQTILVVGCGSGLEAAVLAQQLGAEVTGIDIGSTFNPEAAKVATLERGDAMALRFPDASFDFIYSYHALEHITDPVLALREMRRVLKNDGGYWIGTPNRTRLVGYVGSKDLPLAKKLEWNMQDWKARLRGEFKNELGAHAGFSAPELKAMLGSVFSSTEEMSDAYFRKIYASKQILLKMLQHSRLSRVAYPSVYFMGNK